MLCVVVQRCSRDWSKKEGRHVFGCETTECAELVEEKTENLFWLSENGVLGTGRRKTENPFLVVRQRGSRHWSKVKRENPFFVVISRGSRPGSKVKSENLFLVRIQQRSTHCDNEIRAHLLLHVI